MCMADAYCGFVNISEKNISIKSKVLKYDRGLRFEVIPSRVDLIRQKAYQKICRLPKPIKIALY